MKKLFFILLFISNLLSTETALEDLYMQKKSNKTKIEKGYLNSLNYYYGYTVKQDLDKAKELFILNDDDEFMKIYSLKIKELIDNKIKPDEKTGLEVLKDSYFEYKKTNGENIEDIEKLIYNWYKNKDEIKVSSDGKFKIIKSASNILESKYYPIEMHDRLNLFEIITPKDTLKFYNGESNVYITNFDIINNKLLYDIVEDRYNPVILVDLDSFKGKFIGYHFNTLGEDYSSKYIIKRIGKELIIDLKSQALFENGGGSFSFIASFDSNGENFDSQVIDNFLLEWDYIHNTKNFNKFDNLYADSIQYYTKKMFPKKDVVNDKKRLLKKSPNFSQMSKYITSQKLEKNIFKIYYQKKVLINKKESTHYCILIIEIGENNNVTILSEMDN